MAAIVPGWPETRASKVPLWTAPKGLDGPKQGHQKFRGCAANPIAISQFKESSSGVLLVKVRALSRSGFVLEIGDVAVVTDANPFTGSQKSSDHAWVSSMCG